MTDDQKLLRESALRWLQDHRTPSTTRWHSMAEMGWLGMTVPEAHGGLGQGLGDACVLAEVLGQGPVAEPYAASVGVAALLARCGTAAQQARCLPGIVDGSERVIAAFQAAPLQATRSGEGWQLDGAVKPVQGGATAYLISAQEGAHFHIFIVPRVTPGLSVREVSAVDGSRAAVLTLHAVAVGTADRLAASAADLACASGLATVVACAESVGAMRAALAATLDYTRTRQQFGKPLSANQVLRHRLADMSIACEESSAITFDSAAALEAAALAGDAAACTHIAATVRAKVAQAARRVCEEAIQLHGGMGVTEELTVAHYLKRHLALDALYGSSATHLRTLAGSAAVSAERSLSAEGAAFRSQVRAFLQKNLTPDLQRAARLNTSVFSEPEVGLQWHRKLAAQGWVAPAWPLEYGGTGWSLEQRWIFETECAQADAPALSPLGLRMAGPVIMKFGTPEQKAHYLPRLLSGEDYWCQGYSEPGSGSDLASLKTRAQRASSGDYYVLNGSKIWTTHAHFANRMFALVRTGEGDARKQDGISFLLIDMQLPGITVRPIKSASGDHEVNQVFFDDVRVPVSCRLGDEGQGWTVAKYLLEFERGGAIAAGRLRRALAQVLAVKAEMDADEALACAAVEVDIRALEATELRIMSALTVGQNPGPVSSMLKLRWSEIHQDITRLGLRLLGPDALFWESARPLHKAEGEAVLVDAARPVTAGYLNARAFTIFGGTSEIQREIIARELVG